MGIGWWLGTVIFNDRLTGLELQGYGVGVTGESNKKFRIFSLKSAGLWVITDGGAGGSCLHAGGWASEPLAQPDNVSTQIRQSAIELILRIGDPFLVGGVDIGLGFGNSALVV